MKARHVLIAAAVFAAIFAAWAIGTTPSPVGPDTQAQVIRAFGT